MKRDDGTVTDEELLRQWFDREKSEKGLLDMKCFIADSERATVAEAVRELLALTQDGGRQAVRVAAAAEI